MMHDYRDILGTMTDLIVTSHEEFKSEMSRYPSDCTGDHPRTVCQCKATPLWWDEHGTPRFWEHHPNLSPNIYADEIVLLLISCQGCGREFKVQVCHSQMKAVLYRVRSGAFGPIASMLEEALGMIPNDGTGVGYDGRRDELRQALADARAEVPPTLADSIRDGSIHYGDPPNVDCCPAGPTMNCWDLKVLEFWHRNVEHAWVRVPELEIDLPDMTDADRTGDQ